MKRVQSRHTVLKFVFGLTVLAGLVSLQWMASPSSGNQLSMARAASAPGLPSVVRGPYVGAPIHGAVRHMGDVPDLKEALRDERFEMREFEEVTVQGSATERPVPASRLPPQDSTASVTVPGAGFPGLDFHHWGTGWPPDPNGDVGPTHYVQTVNTSLAVFSKGGRRLKAVTLNSFFDGTGSACDDHNKGDPIVLYDGIADRWLVADMAWTHDTGPYYECLALSASGDPLGTWYQWGLPVSNARWNDYPKLSVWSDGYYMTANMFKYHDSGVLNVRVWALDRASMLSGGPLREVYFDLIDYDGKNYFVSLLPSNLHGPLPPPGAPAYLASIKANDASGPLRVWQLRARWDRPELSTLSGPTSLPVERFGTALDCWGKGRECIPQQGTTKGLHSIHNKLMMQLQYRNLGSGESLWANHTVDADTDRDLAGVRWYEVSDPGGAPYIRQQGTHGGYVGDSTERWMASLAVDGRGDMALGYSASSSNLHPSIRYAGREAGDVTGTLRSEATLKAGSGSQAMTHRWGDYTAMSVDPLDDCTFWYTNEYYTQTNAALADWRTWIGSFRFQRCELPELSGRATDSVTREGIPRARVEARAAVTHARTTDDFGTYQIPLEAGAYRVTALAYGYEPREAVTTVDDDTRLDLALRRATHHQVAGTVVDAVTGYPLQARIFVLGRPVGPPPSEAHSQSDPLKGSYGFELPAHITYTLTAVAEGYEPATHVVAPLEGDTRLDLLLKPDLTSCTAPGYEFVGLREDFETWPPEDWTVHDFISDDSLVWSSNRDYLDGNYTGGDGACATVNSDANGSTPYRTALRTPSIDFTSLPTTTLRYRLNYQDGSCFDDGDRLDVSVSIDGGDTWVRQRRFWDCHEDQGELYNVPGVIDGIDLSEFASQKDVRISWFYNTYRRPPNWYVQIDDVRLGVCRPVSGTVMLTPAASSAEACPCQAQTHHLTFLNRSGVPGVVDVSHVEGAGVTVTSIPSTLGVVPNGASHPFTLTAEVDPGLAVGGVVPITVTASLRADPSMSATAVLTTRLTSLGWDLRAEMGKPRGDQALVATGEHLYQIGGTASHTTARPSRYVYRYSPGSDSWLNATPLITAVRRMDGVALGGRIFVPGGLAEDDEGRAYVERRVQVYDETTDTWDLGAAAPSGRSAYAAVGLGGRVFRIGGDETGSSLAATVPGASLVPASADLTALSQSLSATTSGPATATVDMYDPATDRWNSLGAPAAYPWPVRWPCAGAIGGRIYVAGGVSETARTSSAVYDPQADTWSDGGMADLPVALYAAADFVLDDRLYCAGGFQDGAVSAAVWAYDPATDRWRREADLHEPRYRLEGDTLGGHGYVEAGWDPTASFVSAILERTAKCRACRNEGVSLPLLLKAYSTP